MNVGDRRIENARFCHNADAQRRFNRQVETFPPFSPIREEYSARRRLRSLRPFVVLLLLYAAWCGPVSEIGRRFLTAAV